MEFFKLLLAWIVSSAIISFVLAVAIRSNALCILGSAVITEMSLDLLVLAQGQNWAYPDMVLLAVNINAIVGTPVIVASSIGAVLLARRLYRRRGGASKA